MCQHIHEIAMIAFMTLLLSAAGGDVVRRIIPNDLVIGVAVLGIVSRILGGGWPAMLQSLGAAAGLFVVLAVLHQLRALGGGDVKLATAIALGLPLDSMTGFLTATVLAGGLLAVIHLLLRPIARHVRPVSGGALLRRVWAAECWRIRRHGSLPYGVAIACGGAWMLLHQAG